MLGLSQVEREDLSRFVCRQYRYLTHSATLDASDWIYTCETHLSDRSFVLPLEDTKSSAPVSQAEIDKVKAEYEAKLAAKKAKESEGKKDEPAKGITGYAWSAVKYAGSAAGTAITGGGTATTPASPATSPPAPLPTKFKLASSFWMLKQQEAKARAAREATKGLPNLPNASGLPALR